MSSDITRTVPDPWLAHPSEGPYRRRGLTRAVLPLVRWVLRRRGAVAAWVGTNHVRRS